MDDDELTHNDLGDDAELTEFTDMVSAALGGWRVSAPGGLVDTVGRRTAH